MPDKLTELDNTSLPTAAGNWLAGKRDALLSAAGSSRALGRYDTRMVANKLYRSWQNYLGTQGKQGTTADLAYFITQFFGPERLTALNQSLPNLLPTSGNRAATSTPQTTQQATPVAPQARQQAQTMSPASDEDTADMARYESRVQRLKQLLASPTPDESAVMKEIGATLRDFSGRSEAIKGRVRQFFANNLQGYAQIYPGLQDFVGKDPFSFVQGASPQSAPPNTEAAMPRSPNPFRSERPPPSMRQPPRSESRRRTGRLIEADPSVDIPEPPPNTPKQWSRHEQPLDTTRPPAFLRPKTPTPPTRPAPPPRILSRAQMDQVMVALARMLIASGEAKVSGRRDKARQALATSNPGRSAAPSVASSAPSDPLQTPITAQTLSANRGQMSQRDYQKAERIISAAPNRTATLAAVVQGLGTLDSNTVLSLLQAAHA